MTSMPVLETVRLRIRPPEMDDLDAIHQLYIEAGWANGNPETERQLRSEWLEWAVRNHRVLASLYQPPYGDRVVTLTDGTFVGMVGVVPAMAPFGLLPSFSRQLPADSDPNHFTVEVGLFWAALKSQRGQGYITEAARAVIDFLFTAFNLNRVIAQTEYDNLASMAVMERLGMKIERNPQSEPHWLQVVGILINTSQNENSHEYTNTSEVNQQ